MESLFVRHPVMIPIGTWWDKALSPSLPPHSRCRSPLANGFDAPHGEAKSSYEQVDSALAGWFQFQCGDERLRRLIGPHPGPEMRVLSRGL
ncbi:hypothetical protein ACIP79_41695 [Streptomyces sp. NPDC088747]|uniref:hypothetical protein n=1 Tax=Streptomyces sp. NPDC088747 TaxID=3365886 RepID=UPI00381FB1CC